MFGDEPNVKKRSLERTPVADSLFAALLLGGRRSLLISRSMKLNASTNQILAPDPGRAIVLCCRQLELDRRDIMSVYVVHCLIISIKRARGRAGRKQKL